MVVYGILFGGMYPKTITFSYVFILSVKKRRRNVSFNEALNAF